MVRWKDLYLRVMKPSKGPGRAGIAPNRRGPSFFCLRRLETTQVLAAVITCLVLTMSTGSALVTPAPSPADQLRGPPPLPGGNITPGNNTASIDRLYQHTGYNDNANKGNSSSSPLYLQLTTPHPRLIALSITLNVPQILAKKENRN